MQTRRHFLRSAGTSLAGSVIALSFPLMGRASAKSGQPPNYIIIDLDISGVSKSRFAENLQDKIPSAEMLESTGYDVAYIEKEHFGREPFYPENHCAALNLANIKRHGFVADFPLFYNSVSPNGNGHKDRINFDAEDYISLNRDNPFCLYWKHTVVHPSLQLLQNGHMNRSMKNGLDKSLNQDVIADIEASVKNAVNRVKEKLVELDIAGKTTVLFAG